MKTLLSVAAGLAVVIGLSHLSRAELKVGDPAPDFEMKGSDGKTYKLSDFKDKQAVVLAWYPKAFTGGCTKECKSFKADGEKMRAFQVTYFTASTDEPDVNKKFAESLDADYPILSDPDGSVASRYGVYNADKKFANRVTFYIGANGKILFIDKGVKTDSHGADVAAKLKELGVPAKK
jgi:peroxiredoxin Q/BCP